MAKRYFSYKNLASVSGNWKPTGTMGHHHCVVEHKDGSILVHGSVRGKVKLKEGDTLGYDCGDVWKVPNPNAYRCPLRRAMASAKLPKHTLEISDEPIQYRTSYGKNAHGSCADTETGESVYVLAGEKSEKTLREYSDDNTWQYIGAWARTSEISGGDVIIVKRVCDKSLTRSRRSKVTRVVVRKHVSKEYAAKLLSEFFAK